MKERLNLISGPLDLAFLCLRCEREEYECACIGGPFVVETAAPESQPARCSECAGHGTNPAAEANGNYGACLYCDGSGFECDQSGFRAPAATGAHVDDRCGFVWGGR